METWIAMVIAAPIVVLIILAGLILRDFADQWADAKLRAMFKHPAVAGRLERRRDRVLHRFGVGLTALGLIPVIAALQADLGGGIDAAPRSLRIIEVATAAALTTGGLILIIWWLTARPRNEEWKAASPTNR